MKNFIIFFFIALISPSVIAEDSSNQRRIVTASDYCEFLNHAEAKEGFFYNDKMSSDPLTACLMRTGVPGSYQYFVIVGRENLPESYVNLLNKENYSSYYAITSMEETTNDDFSAELASNKNIFSVTLTSLPKISPIIKGDVIDRFFYKHPAAFIMGLFTISFAHAAAIYSTTNSELSEPEDVAESKEIYPQLKRNIEAAHKKVVDSKTALKILIESDKKNSDSEVKLETQTKRVPPMGVSLERLEAEQHYLFWRADYIKVITDAIEKAGSQSDLKAFLEVLRNHRNECSDDQKILLDFHVRNLQEFEKVAGVQEIVGELKNSIAAARYELKTWQELCRLNKVETDNKKLSLDDFLENEVMRTKIIKSNEEAVDRAYKEYFESVENARKPSKTKK